MSLPKRSLVELLLCMRQGERSIDRGLVSEWDGVLAFYTDERRSILERVQRSLEIECGAAGDTASVVPVRAGWQGVFLADSGPASLATNKCSACAPSRRSRAFWRDGRRPRRAWSWKCVSSSFMPKRF